MLRYLLEKEFKRIRRDKFMPKLIFFIPIMQLIILPFAANFEMRNINLSVVDYDQSEMSTRLIHKITSSDYFILTDVSDQYSQALERIEDNTADVILEIPEHFERDLQKVGGVEVFIAANAVDGTKGGLATSYLNSILQDFNATEGCISVGPGRTIASTALFNPHLSYKAYMVPGIMAFLLTIICGFLPALSLVREKEEGTIEQMNVTPISKYVFLLSKLLPFWIIGFILLSLAIIVSYLVYGLLPVGSPLLIFLFAAVHVFTFTSFGLMVSSVSITQQQTMLTTFFFMILFILLSGLFTPISSMPEWAQRITLFNPVRYIIEVLRMVYLKGSCLTDLLPHLLKMCGFAVSFHLLALLLYKKTN